MAEAEPSREFSPQEAHGLLSLAPTLEALGKLKHNFATLINKAQALGGLIDEKYHAARMATAGAILALVAACGQAESNVKVSPAEPGYQPTAPHQSIEALPSTQTPIIDSRQQPVLTPVKTQNPATRESSPITETPPPTPQTTLEALPTQIQESQTPKPAPTETRQEETSFQQVKKMVEQLPESPEKIQAQEALNQFEKAEQRIKEFKNYEAQIQARGDVTLLQLTQQKFNRLGDAFPEFEIADQVFYLKDENDLRTVLNQLKEKSPDELLTSISESQKQFFDEGKFAGRRRIAYTTPEFAQSPTTEFDLSKTTNPLAPKAAEEFRDFLKEIGLEGQIRLKIILANKLSMGDAAGTFSDKEGVPKIELAPPFRKKDFFHELAHFLDPDRNSFLYNDLTSEEIFDAFIAIEDTLNSDWGRRYPEVSKIFSKEPINAFRKHQNGQPLGPKEFAVVERLEMPAGGWLTPMKDTLRNPDEIFVDFMGTFDKQFSQDFDRKLEDTLHGIREKDWSELVLSQKTLLDELAQRSDWDRAFVELLRESATSVTYSPRYHGALSMTHLRRILFFDAAVGGDTRVAKLFLNLEPKDRKKILDTFLGQWQDNDADTLARSVAVTISGDFELGFFLDKTLENPFGKYFRKIISALTFSNLY